MSFDSKRFVDLLQTQAETITDYSKTSGAIVSSKEIGILKFNGNIFYGTTAYVCGLHLKEFSNHEELTHKGFIKERENDLAEMKTLIKEGLPALNHDLLTMDINVMLKGAREPRLAITVMGMPLCTNAGLGSSAMIKRLLTALGRIEGLPHPKGRIFSIDNRTIPAINPAAAYRIWAAFAVPDLFKLENNKRAAPHALPIHEIIPSCAAHEALLT